MLELDDEKVKEKIETLIAKLKRITESGQNYTEETSKTSFILPLFEALGWDTTNAVADDEVTAEDNISGKRVDYAFRLDHIIQFYVEAKGIDENNKKCFVILGIGISSRHLLPM